MIPLILAAFAGAPIRPTLVTSGITSVDPTLGTSLTGDSWLPRAAIRFTTSGLVQKATDDTSGGLNFTGSGLWAEDLSSGNSASYEIQVTNNSETGAAGSLTGTTGSWQDLSTNITGS